RRGCGSWSRTTRRTGPRSSPGWTPWPRKSSAWRTDHEGLPADVPVPGPEVRPALLRGLRRGGAERAAHRDGPALLARRPARRAAERPRGGQLPADGGGAAVTLPDIVFQTGATADQVRAVAERNLGLGLLLGALLAYLSVALYRALTRKEKP